MEVMEIENKLKKRVPKYECINCDFRCYMKCDWERHILRPKHLKNDKMEVLEIKKTKKTYNCDCGKVFITSSGLWKHTNKCHQNHIIPQTTAIETIDSNIVIKQLIQQNDDFKHLILEQNKLFIGQNQDIQKQNQELQQQILDVCKNGIIQNNTINQVNTTNSNNKTFNLQVFLNEDCKDAMNISDFMNSIQLQLEELVSV
jgi:hypothetical protein